MRAEVDAEAVKRVRAGEHEAFAELYDRYARLVRCLSFDGTGNLSDANDLCQEIFMKAFRQLDNLREPGRFGYWLTGITRNAIVDWQRRQSRDRLAFVETVPEAATLSCEKDSSAELRSLIRELPETERSAIHLFYLDEQPAEATREVLGLSQSGFYKVLARARKLLANKIRSREATSDE